MFMKIHHCFHHDHPIFSMPCIEVHITKYFNLKICYSTLTMRFPYENKCHLWELTLNNLITKLPTIMILQAHIS
jgi:hypothetical protein